MPPIAAALPPLVPLAVGSAAWLIATVAARPRGRRRWTGVDYRPFAAGLALTLLRGSDRRMPPPRAANDNRAHRHGFSPPSPLAAAVARYYAAHA